MRARPTVHVAANKVAHPGAELDVAVVLESASETPVSFVEVRVVGREGAGSSDDGTGASHVVISRSARVSGPTTLAEGRRRFHAPFRLPDDLPPSYEGGLISVRYELQVIVSIPWWPGVDRSFPLLVLPAPGPRLPAAPVTDLVTLLGLRLETALDDRVFAPGDEIHGGLALAGAQDTTPERQPLARRVQVALVGMERRRTAVGEVLAERFRMGARMEADTLAGGREVAFACRLPTEAPVTFFSPRSALFWLVSARVEPEDGPALMCEVPILVTRLAGAPRPGGPRPALGFDGRWRAWAKAGAPYGLSMDEGALRLTGELGGCMAAIGVIARGGDARLTGEIRYRDLGLGLHVNGYLAGGRDPEQIRAALDPDIRSALAGFGTADMDDERAIVRARDPSSGDEELAAFIGDVAQLAGRIGVLRRRVPPPGAMTASLPAFLAFARRLGAPLTVGSMSIRGGHLDGDRFDVWTEFAGAAPASTVAALHVHGPVPDLPDAGDASALEGLSSEGRHMALALVTEARSLRVEGGKMTLTLREPIGDPARLEGIMRDMALLARLLRERRAGGPYR